MKKRVVIVIVIIITDIPQWDPLDFRDIQTNKLLLEKQDSMPILLSKVSLFLLLMKVGMILKKISIEIGTFGMSTRYLHKIINLEGKETQIKTKKEGKETQAITKTGTIR